MFEVMFPRFQETKARDLTYPGEEITRTWIFQRLLTANKPLVISCFILHFRTI